MGEFMRQDREFLGRLHARNKPNASSGESPKAGAIDLSYSSEIPCLATNALSLSAKSLVSPVVLANSGKGLPWVCSASYLVICGRASARSMDAPSGCTSR